MSKKIIFNRNNHYNNFITYQFSGIKDINIDNVTKNKLNKMFGNIQGLWLKYSPNYFINFKYVLFKCLQLLEKNELLKHFRLYNSLEKYDDLWRKICNDLRWEFIRTV